MCVCVCVCVCVHVCRFEELRSHIKVIKNSTKIRDVSRVSEGVCSVAVRPQWIVMHTV